MLQIRKIREFTPRGHKKPKKYDAPLDPDVTVESILDLVGKAKHIIDALPEEERINIFYTLGHVPEGAPEERKARKWIKQDVIPFDIDDIDTDRLDEYPQVLYDVLKVDGSKCWTMFSGNGLQILIKPKQEITSHKFFEDNLIYYKTLCSKVNDRLKVLGLKGIADTSAFAPNRLFRCPHSFNKKPGRPTRLTKLINDTIEPIEYSLQAASGMPLVKESEQISKTQLRYFKIDTKSVLDGCEFLKECKQFPRQVSEPQWYAILSILAPMEDASNLAIEYSKDHPSYSKDETLAKLEQAKDASGPRTCENISSMFDCTKCPNHKLVKSPVSIKDESFIATAETGFHIMDDKGRLHPQYEDLMRHYRSKFPYANATNCHYQFGGTHYTELNDEWLDAFAQDNFRPTAKNTMASEFRGIIKRTNVQRPEFFTETTHRKINLDNGILDLDSLELHPHSHDYGFKQCLPFAYDIEAVAPTFSDHLDAVTCSDPTLKANLLEFMGYALSSDLPRAQKILVLTGGGQNGKSTFLEILKALGGRGVTALNVKDLTNPFHRQSLDGALFNILEEVPEFTNKDFWEELKGLATGARVTASKKFKDPYQFDNRAKFIMTCNELPKGANPNHGFFRRLLIVPFNATFMGQNDDKFIGTRIIEQELPGVLNMVLDAYARLRTNAYNFTQSDTIQRAVDAYRLESDNVASWLEEHLTLAPGPLEEIPKGSPQWMVKDSEGFYFASIEEMHKQYMLDAQDHGEKVCAYKTFARRLNYWLEVNVLNNSAWGPVQVVRRNLKDRKLRLVQGVKWKCGAEC